MQISFCMACSMPLYPLGRKKKRQETEKWFVWFAGSGILILPPYILCLDPRGRSTVQGRIQAWELRGRSRCFSQAFFPWTRRRCHPVLRQNTKADRDFTVSTQNKWTRQKRTPWLCKQKSSSVLIRNGTARNAFLGMGAQAAEVSRGRAANPAWFSPAGKSKPASLLNLRVVHSKNNSGLRGWTNKACKGEPYSLKALWAVNCFFKRKNMQFEIGKWKSHQVAGWKIHQQTCYLEPAKPSRGTALVSLNRPMNYTPLPTLRSMLL